MPKRLSTMALGSGSADTTTGIHHVEATSNNNFVTNSSESTFEEFFDDPLHRLHRLPKVKPKPPPDPNQALVSDLPSQTLKWIKRRRTTDSEQKVVLSHQAERQLREMFNSIDFNGEGVIALGELTEAIDYVSGKTKGVKGLQGFRNLGKVFEEMDDNGDGTLDFAEFTMGMTGTANSALEKASAFEIERLFSYFVEYGEMRQRENAISKINATLHAKEPSLPPSRSAHTNQGDGRGSVKTRQHTTEASFSGDTQSYQNFKTLFGSGDSMSSIKVQMSIKNENLASKKVKHLESMLNDFVITKDPSLGSSSSSSKINSKEYKAVEERLKEVRRKEIELQCNDPDLLAATQRNVERRKSMVAISSSSSARRTSALVLSGDSGVTQWTSSLDLQTKDEISLRITAKKDAYESLRGFTQEETDHIMAAANAMTRSQKTGNNVISGSQKNLAVQFRASAAPPVISLSPTRASTIGLSALHSNTKSPKHPKAIQKPATRASLCFAAPPH